MTWSRLWLLLAACSCGCGDEGTVNNDDVQVASTQRISLGWTGAEMDHEVFQFDLSGDGARLAFSSFARNVHPEDMNPSDSVVDLYVRDLRSGEVHLASRADGPAGAKGRGHAHLPSISHDGRRVAFVSEGSLDPLDTDALRDVYVRDVESHTTMLVSRGPGAAGVKANAASTECHISPDGNWVAFVSAATNLLPSDTDGVVDVYLRNLETGDLELVSIASSGTKSNGTCSSPRLSEGAARVSFVSLAINLASPVPALNQQIYVRDRARSETWLVSRADGPAGDPALAVATFQRLSADGRFVVWSSGATNLHADDVDAAEDVFLRDIDGQATELVSRAPGADGRDANFTCRWPTISRDGRFVSFTSLAANLGEQDENGHPDIYIRDRLLHRTFRASVRTFGGESNDISWLSVITADGRFVAFQSEASNLVDGDENLLGDVFLRGPLW